MTTSTPPPLTYRQSGVNIDKGNALVERIKPLAKNTLRSGVIGTIGGFGGLFDVKAAGFNDPVLVSATDRVGTKLKLAIDTGIHNTIGIDLVAMCVNDIIVQGAEPLFFLDYFATSSLDPAMAEQVISGIADGCNQAGCALLGGETAEMPGLYQPGDYDLAGFAVGAAERDTLLPKQNAMTEGDIILGLVSSGPHSNGYSLIRKVVETAGLDYDSPAPFDSATTLGNALLTPTRIYIKSCLKALTEGRVKAFAHITGGGLTENIPRILPEHLAATINAHSWQQPAVFDWLQEAGNIATKEMHRTFNCGIGMVVVCDSANADTIATTLETAGETVFTLGNITTSTDESVIFS